MAHLNEDQLRFLFENSADAILLTAPDGNIFAANKAACNLFGRTEAEIINLGRNGLVDITDPRLALLLAERAKKGIAAGELNFRKKDGSIFQAEASSVLFTDSTGEVKSSMIIHDITARKQAERELKEKEIQLQFAHEATNDGLWDVNLQDNKVYMSPRGCEILGFAPDEMNKKFDVWMKLVHPDDMEKTQKVLNEHLTGKRPNFIVEQRLLTKSGEWKWIFTRGKVVSFDALGNPLRIIGTHTDISDRKQVELMLIKSEERFRSTLDNMFEGCQIIGFDWKYLYLNDAAEIHNRRPNKELLGQNYKDAWPGIETTEIFEVVKDCMDNRVTRHLKTEFVFPIGGNGWFELIIQPVPEGVFIVSIDITQRKQSEEALRESEERLRLSLSAANQGLYDLNIHTDEAIVNEEYALMLGFDPKTFTESNSLWRERLHPDDKEAAIKAYTDYIEGKTDAYKAEFRQKTGNGEWKWILSQGKILEYDTQGKPLRMLGTHTDITTRKRLENNEKLANEVLGILNKNNDSVQMIKDIIIAIKKWTGYEAVAIRLQEGEDFPYYSTSGFSEEFVKIERYLCNYQTDGNIVRDSNGKPILECMCGNILTGKTDSTKSFFTLGGSFKSNNTTKLLTETTDSERLTRTRNRCNSFGYESVALIPIRSGPEIIGLLQLNDHRENIFTDEIIPFFEGLVSSIGIALKRNRAEQSVKQSEEKYRSIFENVKDVFYQTNLDGIIKEVSPSVKYFNFTREELIGSPVSDLYDNPNDRDTLLNIMLNKGELNDYEIKLRTKSGNALYVSINARLVINSENKPDHIDGALRDITARKQAEEKLMESEERFRSLFENNLSVMLLIDPNNGQIIDANDAAANYYGWTREQLIEMRIQNIDILGESLNSELKKANTQKQLHFEFKHKKADGSIRNVEFFSSTIEIHGKNYLHSIIHDITSRKQAEKQIKLLNRAIEQSPVSVMITDKEGILVYVNPKFTEVTGYSYNEAIGKNPRILQSGTHPKEFFDDLWKTILSGNDWHGEFHNKKKNGESYWEKSVISPILNSRGNIAFFIAVQEDITEMKKLTHELIEAKTKAEENDQLKTVFLHNISHEIRTPINAIVGFSEFLNSPDLKPEKREQFVKIITQSSNHLLSIITDIVNMSSIEAGQEKLFEKQTNINIAFKQLYKQYSAKAIEHQISLNFFTPNNDNDVTIITDDSKLIQILSNLINNAIKFTKNGFVNYGYSLKDQIIEFYVKDSGIGIPSYLHNEIFQRFRQVDYSHTRKYGGSGLGLAIAKAYVELLGGSIWLKSEPDKGSDFYFTIPYRTLETDQITPEQTTSDVVVKITNKKCILVAEDEDYNFMLLEEILEDSNIEIVRAVDGQSAIDLCKSGRHFDIILMDLKMPGINGYEATKQIRALFPYIPIIAQTAYTNDIDKRKAFESGCSDFISKPFNKPQLLQKLKAFLEK